MANSYDGNVHRIDTTDTELPATRSVKGVKYVGAASGTATIKELGSGNTLWEHSGDVIIFDDVCIRADKGIEVEVTNGAVVYVYEKTR